MLTVNNITKIYDTILSIPGMNETVKIDLRVSRNNILLLNHVIERGLSSNLEKKNNDLLNSIPKENLEDLRVFAKDCLRKAGLEELSDKLNSFSESQ